MDAKEFLDENVGKRFAPSRSKIILTVLLFSISSFFSASTYQTHGDTLTGPVPIGGPTLISTGYPLMYFHATREGLIFVNLILDAIFWYLVSSLAVMLFSKYFALRNAKRGRGPQEKF